VFVLSLVVLPARADDPAKPEPLTPWQLRALVAHKPTGADLDTLRDRVYATFGKKELEAGTAKAKVQESLVCWAIASDPKLPGGPPRVVNLDENRKWDMTPIGEGADLFVLFQDVPNCTEFGYAYEVGSRQTGKDRVRVEFYNYGPDSTPRDGVPKGAVTKAEWKSKVFADTVRDYWVYVPAQYDPKTPACVMVFQDGGSYVNEKGDFRVPVVLDNLIARGELPVIIGIFINPGEIPQEGKPSQKNRSVEYDTLSDAYARFLKDEILPEVGKKYNLTTDPAGRAICGISSGGICAFTVAWEMPDQFGKVLSHVGSFTNIRGGHAYPAQIRKAAKKDIRVYLQDNTKDLDNEFGNWPLANQEMAAALKFKGYDYTFVMGPGFHSGKFGGANLPEELKWLWRDYRPKAN
jgi:enterochelin esterase family protein